MKMRQLIVTIELIEHDTNNYPKIVVPKTIAKGMGLFMGKEIYPAIEATKWLANKMGINLQGN